MSRIVLFCLGFCFFVAAPGCASRGAGPSRESDRGALTKNRPLRSPSPKTEAPRPEEGAPSQPPEDLPLENQTPAGATAPPRPSPSAEAEPSLPQPDARLMRGTGFVGALKGCREIEPAVRLSVTLICGPFGFIIGALPNLPEGVARAPVFQAMVDTSLQRSMERHPGSRAQTPAFSLPGIAMAQALLGDPKGETIKGVLVATAGDSPVGPLSVVCTGPDQTDSAPCEGPLRQLYEEGPPVPLPGSPEPDPAQLVQRARWAPTDGCVASPDLAGLFFCREQSFISIEFLSPAQLKGSDSEEGLLSAFSQVLQNLLRSQAGEAFKVSSSPAAPCTLRGHKARCQRVTYSRSEKTLGGFDALLGVTREAKGEAILVSCLWTSPRDAPPPACESYFGAADASP